MIAAVPMLVGVALLCVLSSVPRTIHTEPMSQDHMEDLLAMWACLVIVMLTVPVMIALCSVEQHQRGRILIRVLMVCPSFAIMGINNDWVPFGICAGSMICSALLWYMLLKRCTSPHERLMCCGLVTHSLQS